MPQCPRMPGCLERGPSRQGPTGTFPQPFFPHLIFTAILPSSPSNNSARAVTRSTPISVNILTSRRGAHTTAAAPIDNRRRSTKPRGRTDGEGDDASPRRRAPRSRSQVAPTAPRGRVRPEASRQPSRPPAYLQSKIRGGGPHQRGLCAGGECEFHTEIRCRHRAADARIARCFRFGLVPASGAFVIVRPVLTLSQTRSVAIWRRRAFF